MKNKYNTNVLVAMSGGVDSSVTAFLLRQKGYNCTGVFIRLGIDNQEEEEVARKVCQKLNMKFYPVDEKDNFKKEVVDYFVNSYLHGYTPNPCVKCNKFIKFQKLLNLADNLFIDYISTGHYAKIKKENDLFCLYKGEDKIKDQSYFLYNLNQNHLKRIFFPLGDYKKEKIKEIADQNKLPYSEKESQDICFVTGEHNDFLKKRIKPQKGPIKNLHGEVLGEHQGLPFYTKGQRKGIDVGAIGPLYVVECDYKNNILYVSNDKDDPKLYSSEFSIEEVNWVHGEPNEDIIYDAVIRYGGKPVQSYIKKTKKREYKVFLKEKIRAATKGQSAVFYNNEEVLGGGVIK